jgi:hypothetical protein
MNCLILGAIVNGLSTLENARRHTVLGQLLDITYPGVWQEVTGFDGVEAELSYMFISEQPVPYSIVSFALTLARELRQRYILVVRYDRANQIPVGNGSSVHLGTWWAMNDPLCPEIAREAGSKDGIKTSLTNFPYTSWVIHTPAMAEQWRNKVETMKAKLEAAERQAKSDKAMQFNTVEYWDRQSSIIRRYPH